MQNLKFGAFGVALGAMIVFLPLSGKLNDAKDQEIKVSILTEVSCGLPKQELEKRLSQVIAPPDAAPIEKGQNEEHWNRVKQTLLADCYN